MHHEGKEPEVCENNHYTDVVFTDSYRHVHYYIDTINIKQEFLETGSGRSHKVVFQGGQSELKELLPELFMPQFSCEGIILPINQIKCYCFITH